MNKERNVRSQERWVYNKNDIPELHSLMHVEYTRDILIGSRKVVDKALNISYMLSDGNSKWMRFQKSDIEDKVSNESLSGEVYKVFQGQQDLDMPVYEFLYDNLPKRARELLIKPSD